METVTTFIATVLVSGSIFGLITWLLARNKITATEARLVAENQIEQARMQERLAFNQGDLKAASDSLKDTEEELVLLREQLNLVRDERSQLAERVTRLPILESEVASKEAELFVAQQEISRLSAEVSSVSMKLESEIEHAHDKLKILNDTRVQMTDQFKALANEVMEDKSKRFTEQNQVNINQLLEPLKTKIGEFQIKVEEVYVQEGKDRSALAEQVKQMLQLNQQLSQDTLNLTRALKGQSKTQGSWGELILERVLEASGLRKGHEYDVQENHSREDGSRAMPDVVVHLPENRHLVIDAKVSLTAYEECVNAESDTDRELAMKRHIDSVRAHIKNLAGKNYQQLYGLQSLDFVLMFIPVEPAFMIAISHDSELWQEAWNKNVILVSPSTLLFVVRTVAHLWRQEQQSKNAQEIADKGADLYDKLVGFVDDLEIVGSRIKQASNSYEDAHKKLTSGRGNVIRQAEQLRTLGVKPSKGLPKLMLNLAIEENVLE